MGEKRRISTRTGKQQNAGPASANHHPAIGCCSNPLRINALRRFIRVAVFGMLLLEAPVHLYYFHVP